jgi:hypothetical protein
MLAERVLTKPSYYIGTPVVTIFNGAQSWGDLKSRARVYLRGYPDLIGIYRRQGWDGEKLEAAERWGAANAAELLGRALRERSSGVLAMFPRYLLTYGSHHGVIPTLWKAFLDSRCCWFARAWIAVGQGVAKVHRYLFHNSRPARWIRAKRTAR